MYRLFSVKEISWYFNGDIKQIANNSGFLDFFFCMSRMFAALPHSILNITTVVVGRPNPPQVTLDSVNSRN